MRLATTFRTWPGWRKPGAARIASSATPARTGGRAAGTGTRPAFVWAPPGTLPRSRSVGHTRACPAAGRTRTGLGPAPRRRSNCGAAG